jgi:NADH-quinone oxidoreductase subunit N
VVRTLLFHGENTGSTPVKNNVYMDAIILKSFIPEIFFSMCILFQLIFNVKLINNLSFNFPIVIKEAFIQTIFILFCVFLLLSNLKIEGFFSNFILLNDSGGNVIKMMIVFSCLFILVIITRGILVQELNFFEFFTIFLFSTFSLFILISAYDLISAYLAIEMQALCFYILSSFRRNSAFSTEAGLKYFIAGSFVSSIFLLGSCLIYGALGTLNFHNLNIILSFSFDESYIYLKSMVLLGGLFIFITLFFKVAAAPFHFWSPDIYEGSPLSSTVVFSILPKVAIFNFFIKCSCFLSLLFYEFQYLFLIISIISISVGTLLTLRQKRIKRLFIYSSIAQVGFIIAALSSCSLDGLVSIYFFLFIYILTSILVWNFITQFYVAQQDVNKQTNGTLNPVFVSSFSNFFTINKISSFSFLATLFSIAGIPPFCGFLAKILVLLSLVNANFFYTSFTIVIISSISAFYYIRIVKAFFFETKDVKIKNKTTQTTFLSSFLDFQAYIAAICTMLLIFFFFFPGTLILLSHYAVLNSFGA